MIKQVDMAMAFTLAVHENVNFLSSHDKSAEQHIHKKITQVVTDNVSINGHIPARGNIAIRASKLSV